MAKVQANNGRRNQLGPWISWRHTRFWLLAALLAYTLLGFLAAPPLINWLAVSNIEKTGRTASIENIKVNPFLLTIEITGAHVRDPDGTAILSFDRYFTNFQLSSLFNWAWTFRDVQLSGLFVYEERFAERDTRYIRLIDAFATDEPDEDEAEEAGALPRLVIEKFKLQNGRLTVRDQMAGDFEGALGPINVDVNDLRTLPDHSGAHTVSIRTDQDGLIEWRGTIEVVPFASEGHLTISGKGLADAFRYADHFLPFKVLGDSVSVELDYHAGMRDTSPFLSVENLHVSAQGTRIRPDHADSDTLTTETIDISGGSLHWPEQVARVEHARVDGAVLTAGLLPDGTLDLLTLAPEFPENELPQTETGTDAPAPPWTLEVGAFDIIAATVRLTDATLEPKVELSLEALNLGLKDIDNREGTRIPAELKLRLSSGGSIGYSGQVQVLPGTRAEGQLTLEGIALAAAQPYVEPMVRVAIEDGTLSLSADLVHGPEQLARLEGKLQVDQLRVHDTRQNERLLAWDRLQLDRFEADLAANRLETSDLEFDGLFGRFHIAEDLSTNVSDLLIEKTADASGEGAQPIEISELQIGGLRFANTGLDFSDFSLPLPFRTNIQNLNGEISTLSTTSSQPATVSMEGQVNEFGQALIEGEVNPWSPTDLTHIDMTFRNLDLPWLTPYTVQFAGYAIDEGRVDLDLGYRLDQRKLNGSNKIVIRDIVLGDKVEHPDAGSLPLGLAIALLTDANGVIDLDVPVEGDLDNPEFGIGNVIWQALGNIITKAVTAPFRLLGSLVGIDSEDFGTLHFAAGRADISPPDREQLLKLSEAMLQRPELTVEIGGVFDAIADTAALKRIAVESLFDQRSTEIPIGPDELSGDHARRVLESLAAEQLPSLDLVALQEDFTRIPEGTEKPTLDQPAFVAGLRSRLEQAQVVDATELTALANARAEAALAALQQSAPDAELNAIVAGPREVEADNEREIPLELGVSTD